MKKISSLLIFILSTSICLCQETFPTNGVENNYKSPIAFVNAKIHQSSSKVIEHGMMLVQDDKILSVGDSITIPKNAIIKDLNGDFIYPSFIELISDFGIEEPPASLSDRNIRKRGPPGPPGRRSQRRPRAGCLGKSH